MYQDLSMHHDWPVRKAIVDLLISMKRPLKGDIQKLGYFLRGGAGGGLSVFTFVLFFP